jgi:DNA polymerase-3 subunit epsilon
LRDKPRFSDICDELIAFIGDAPLVAHNAFFDLGFLNAEFERCQKILLTRDRLVDTLMLARRRHPGGSNRLDDLCARYGIDNSRRSKHGALLDAELLAEVYVELIGGRQASLILVETSHETTTARHGMTAAHPRPAPLAPRVSDAEREAHALFITSLGANAIWLDYSSAAVGQ